MAGLFSLVEWNNYIVSNVGVNFPNWAFFVINLILFSIILKLVYWLFKKVFRLFTSKTETTLDDDLIDAVEYPLIAILVIVFLISQMSFLTSNEFVLTWTHKVGIALIIISVTWFLYKLIGIIDKYGFTELARRTKSDFDDQLYPLLRKILRVILVLLAAFYILRWFEIDITPLIAGVGLGGLALAFAAQKVLGDIFGGVSIFTSEPFKKGDTVRTKDATGTVEEIGLRYTRIKTLDGTIEVIPNSIISSEPLENISKRKKEKLL
jgi:MscS family membrane protein